MERNAHGNSFSCFLFLQAESIVETRVATTKLSLFPKNVHVLLDTLNLLSMNLKESVVHNCEGCFVWTYKPKRNKI